MARAPQSRQHPWLSELVAGPPSRHCPQEPVVALPALGAAHQPAVCCARRRASQRRRTPRQRRGRAFASVALLPPVVETASAAAPLASKFPTRSVPSTPSPTDRGRWECRLDDVRTRTQRLLIQLENTSTPTGGTSQQLHPSPAAGCFGCKPHTPQDKCGARALAMGESIGPQPAHFTPRESRQTAARARATDTTSLR